MRAFSVNIAQFITCPLRVPFSFLKSMKTIYFKNKPTASSIQGSLQSQYWIDAILLRFHE